MISLAALSTAMAGCTTGGVGTPTVSTPPATAVDPTPTIPGASTTAPSQSATPTVPSGPSVAAKGTLELFGPVSDVLVGTCQKVGGAPTLSLEDGNNDFFETVAITATLSSNGEKAERIAGEFGQDSEGISRTLLFDGAKPATGTSAKVTVKGRSYTISGKALVTEQGAKAKKGEVTPFAITVTCASGTW